MTTTSPLSWKANDGRRLAAEKRARERTEGKRFGKLTARSRAGSSKDGQALWSCECDCGETTVVRAGQLHGGKTQSCGCLGAERTREVLTKEVVTYLSAHARVRRLRGAARTHRCFDCGGQALDWSYDGSDPADLRDSRPNGYGARYSLDPGRYVARCRACHNAHDSAARGADS